VWEHTVERDLEAAVAAVATAIRRPSSPEELHWQVIQTHKSSDRETRRLVELRSPLADSQTVMAPCDSSGRPLCRRDWI
jgi:hypothetical protein